MIPKATYIGQPVRSLQTMLRTIANHTRCVEPIVPDGIYGKSTAESVRQFQLANQLLPTGIADLITWETIHQQYQEANLEKEPASPIQIIINGNESLNEGKDRPYLYLAQAMLMFISEMNSQIPPPRFSGKLDEDTVSSISGFQAAEGLMPNGKIDKKTWRALTDQFAIYAHKFSFDNTI